MSTLKSVIITLPKGLKKDSGLISTDLRSGTKLNFTTSILADKLKLDNRRTLKHMEDTIMDTTILKQEPINIRGKKRRLDHLTWEEKLQRKKLKNRVAAQTSRDRKKAKLDELEETVRMLTERNDILLQECSLLRTENESLLNESERMKMEKDSEEKKERLCSMCQGRVNFTVPSTGSAESRVNPLPQGGSVQLAEPLMLTPSAIVLLKILTLSLLSRNYSVNSKETITSTDSRNWPKAFCEKLPQKWKHILLDQMSRYQARKKPPENLQWWMKHQESWKPIIQEV